MKRANFVMKLGVLTILACLFFNVVCYAQETLTITTYYPSPDGIYNNLNANFFQADRVAVGDGNDPTVMANGVLDFLPLGADPAVVGGSTGSIYYNNPTNTLRYYNGTIWFPIQPAQLVVYVQGAPVDCVPIGTHVVGVLDNNRRGASMEPCDAVGGADPDFPPLNIGPPHCVPLDGFMICH